MKRLLSAILTTASLLVAGAADAKERPDSPPSTRMQPRYPTSQDRNAPGERGPSRVASRFATAVDTTVLGSWDFDGPAFTCDAQGWVSVDTDFFHGADGVYFHVDDFAGLSGGSFGRLVALEGNQSMWCGARPGPAVCGYAVLPGYGNRWNQSLEGPGCLPVTDTVTIGFLAAWDTEPCYDEFEVQYDECDEFWTTLGPEMCGIGSGLVTRIIPPSAHSGNLRIRLRFFSDNAWSDEDGLWDTDGAVIVDSLTVWDGSGVVLPTETFESESVGDTETISGNWTAVDSRLTYGDFAAMFPGTQVLQENPCMSNSSCAWAFFNGSTYDYSCGGYPEQAVVPYYKEIGPADVYIANDVWSPWVELTGSGNSIVLAFDVYRHLPLDTVVRYVWFVRSYVDDCPGPWRDKNFVYIGSKPEWYTHREELSGLIDPGATHVQVALGVRDMCGFHCSIFSSGSCHTHAPLFDNVRLLRLDDTGPQWRVDSWALFQDNFATDGTVTGTVRADMAADIQPSGNPNVLPGDSACVDAYNFETGLAPDPYTGFGPAVYAYVSVWPQGQPGKSGASLTDDGFRYPVVDSLDDGGAVWYCIRMDTSFADGNTRVGPQLDRFCVDLNDDLFTPGDTVCFFFAAESGAPASVVTYWSEFTGRTGNIADVLTAPMEFTCLPAGGPARGGDILYVDHYDGLGAQPFFEDAFEFLGIADQVDRFDVRDPEGVHPAGSIVVSGWDNTLATRVVNVAQQLLGPYRKIIWNSGHIEYGAIADGSGVGKADDIGVLYDFIAGLDTTGGVYFSGDNLATTWENDLDGASAGAFRSDYMNFILEASDHVAHGIGISPLVVGENGSMFAHGGDRDSLVAYGGCPGQGRFDVLAVSSPGFIHAKYQDGTPWGAIVGQQTTNPNGKTVSTVLSGISFHNLRDAEPEGVPARAHHLRDILAYLGNIVNTPVAAGATPNRNRLAQNYPNPFNPTTTIAYEIRKRGHVSLVIYNVAGQRVATLVDRVQAPGVTHVAEWDGRDTRGAGVASGVYFYRLSAPGFERTRKMVLLK